MSHTKINNRTVLPNFFCIGAKRAGTTWLYEILKNHPQIYLCQFKKETHYFSIYYDKGLEWYARFFPREDLINGYKVIGEIAPTYIYFKNAPKYIQQISPDVKFIVILRNPIDRLFSEYKYYRLNFGYNKSFEKYLIEKPIEKYDATDAFNRGCYSNFIKHWLKIFPKDRFLFLIFEKMMQNKDNALREISRFLEIDFKKFDTKILNKTFNPSSIPLMHGFYLLSYKINDFLLSKEFYRISNLLSRLKRISYFFGRKDEEIQMNPKTEKELYLKYKDEIKNLKDILNINLDIWKAK